MRNIKQHRNHAALRLTLDTPEDLALLTHMIAETEASQLGYEAIENILVQHPEWIAINAHIEQKKV
jgi:spore coat polysaccharide biosynthesis protein SpsF